MDYSYFLQFGDSDDMLVSINLVPVRQVWLVLGWVTV